MYISNLNIKEKNKMTLLVPLIAICILVLVFINWPKSKKIVPDTCIHDWNKWKDLHVHINRKECIERQTRTCKRCGKREERNV